MGKLAERKNIDIVPVTAHFTFDPCEGTILLQCVDIMTVFTITAPDKSTLFEHWMIDE